MAIYASKMQGWKLKAYKIKAYKIKNLKRPVMWPKSGYGEFYFNLLDGIYDTVSNNSLTDISAGSTGYLDSLDSNNFVSVAATIPLDIPDRGITSHPNFSQFLATPLIPANQTTASLGTGQYFLWILGGGSVSVSANSATITGAGSATEGSGVNFEVTGAGTVDVVITGECTHFQLITGTVSLYPIFHNTTGTIASRAGTAKAADLVGEFPKLFDALEGIDGATAVSKISGVWTPGVDYVDAPNLSKIITVNASATPLWISISDGRIRLLDGVTSIEMDINFAANTPYPFEIVYGPNTALAADKMQLNIKVNGTWQSAIADFDGSFDPTTDLIFGLSNPYQSSVSGLKSEKLRQSHWRP